ncbi:hypothetical protein NEUTE1DRAFT_149397 [Neurospora tetrasperma FGSC 2508]|nr:uncharacterized protein NEUTE1DRAFT_149397 [Neurospora tetrasperma FGSC 2508]EGO51669.1 hypothetical protein NEUTE1DRAFT_149397 [Neurospora tetrasperma FGSC 2508]EGZ78331.1 hypothetical protein NEUTE2DRAFT_162987 [Neurospora tetrasperma FGSC 2509]
MQPQLPAASSIHKLKHRHIPRSSTTLLSPAMSSQDTRSMSQRLRPRRPSTFLTLAPIISGAEQKPKVASADEAALESPTESVKQVEADSAEAIKRRASSVSSQSSTTGGFRFLRNH